MTVSIALTVFSRADGKWQFAHTVMATAHDSWRLITKLPAIPFRNKTSHIIQSVEPRRTVCVLPPALSLICRTLPPRYVTLRATVRRIVSVMLLHIPCHMLLRAISWTVMWQTEEGRPHRDTGCRYRLRTLGCRIQSRGRNDDIYNGANVIRAGENTSDLNLF
jgi:hypothetical protein